MVSGYLCISFFYVKAHSKIVLMLLIFLMLFSGNSVLFTLGQNCIFMVLVLIQTEKYLESIRKVI